MGIFERLGRRRQSSAMTSADFVKLPRHVAIIMDGNGRWAKQHKAEEDAQKLTDKAIKDMDTVAAAKEKEIMEV